jgi:hypothetical protein
VQHRELIATAFRVGGLLLGIPSSVAFAFFGFGAASLHFLSPRLTPGGKSGDQLIDLLVSGARILARLFEFFGGGVEWLLAVLSVVSFGCLVFAVVLHFTGRGVHASRGVARTMGILLVILPLLVSFIGVMALRKPVPFVVSSLTFALSTCVIWALGGASPASIHSRRESPKCHASKTGSLWLWLLWP